ncbi:MAG: hypothetical protein ACQETD_01260 [Pseudomonadota bacterium]
MKLSVAAWGWRDAGWEGFYPEDLPAEWRLDYYANQYEAMVLPCAEWQREGDETLREWLEEAPEGFRFYWELRRQEDAARLLALYRGDSALPPPGGWLASQEGGWPQEELAALAPFGRCEQVGLCRGRGLATLPVAETLALRSLRAEIDALTAEGCEHLLLVVFPSPGAAANLERLHTLCQLYG